MNRAFYLHLSMDNLKKNARTIIPYILTSTFTILMLYLTVSLSTNPGLKNMMGTMTMTEMLGYGVVVIKIFALIFLFYTHSFLMKRRQKEFALFSMLGMEKKHLARVLFYETCICLVISLFGGIVLGMLFDKAAFLGIAKILQVKNIFGFHISSKAIQDCLITFGCIYLLIYLYSVIRLRASSPIQLLQSSKSGQKEPKARWILSVVGLVCLIGGYYLSLSTKNPLAAFMNFFIAVILVIIGTYLLFTTVSVAFLKLLKKNKQYYYQTNHFISVSSMMFRMKQNAIGLANICILSCMVLVTLSTTLSMYSSIDKAVDSMYPRDAMGTVYQDGENVDFDQVSKDLKALHIETKDVWAYKLLIFTGSLKDGKLYTNYDEAQNDSNKVVQINCLMLDDFNKIEKTKYSLKPNEILMYSNSDFLKQNHLKLFQKNYVVKKHLKSSKLDENNPEVLKRVTLVVDSLDTLKGLYQGQLKQYGTNASKVRAVYGFNCDGKDTSVIQKITNHETDSLSQFVWGGKEANGQEILSMYAGFLVIGIFLSFLFMMATILIMYYKQITEGYEDKERYVIMQKVGLEQRDVKKAIHSQVLTVFFMPLIVAGIHICFAFPMIEKLLHLLFVSDTILYIKVTIGCFVVFSLIYVLIYSLTSKVYYGIVSKKS